MCVIICVSLCAAVNETTPLRLHKFKRALQIDSNVGNRIDARILFASTTSDGHAADPIIKLNCALSERG